MNKRLLIIDGMNEFLRSYIVNPTISTNGILIGGVVGFLKSLQKHIREISPDLVIVCWDGGGGSKRKREINKNYKDGRKPIKLNRFMSGQLSQTEENENKLWQMVRLSEYLEDLPIIQLMFDNVEGDDLIAFVSQLEMFISDQKVILSSDKDFYQLLDNKTIVYRPVQKEVMNGKSVLKRYAITTNNFCLARAISGDESDKLKGVEGVGLKTVANRFPFLNEEKIYNITDVENYCKEKINEGSKLAVYHNIKNSIQLVKENYSLMQLFSPQMSIQDKDKIKHILTHRNFEFHQAKFEARMIKDDFNLDFSFEMLYSWSRKVVHNENR